MPKVLVIDDDVDILDAIQLALSMAGYTVEALPKGDGAYAKILTFHPDVVILDVMLSGSDGCQICQQLKSDPQTQHIPIVMISAKPEAKEATLSCGADSF